MKYWSKNPPPPAGGFIPELGDRRTFVPTAFNPGNTSSGLSCVRPDIAPTVTGRVIYVNEDHRWCRVEYDSPLGPQHEGFKF